jgi:hypothetical protein
MKNEQNNIKLFILEKQYDQIITIHKKINSDGIWFDTPPLSC